MTMISVLARRRFVFTHPSMRTSKAVVEAIANAQPNTPLEGYFSTVPDNFRAQPAPDWIKSDPLWAIAEKTGDIFEVPVPPAKVQIPEKVPETVGKRVVVIPESAGVQAQADQGPDIMKLKAEPAPGTGFQDGRTMAGEQAGQGAAQIDDKASNQGDANDPNAEKAEAEHAE